MADFHWLGCSLQSLLDNYYLHFLIEAVILEMFNVVVDCTHIFAQQLKESCSSFSN